MVTREQRQALHREYAEAMKDLPYLEQEGFRHWCEAQLIETRAKLDGDKRLYMEIRAELAAARRAGEGEA